MRHPVCEASKKRCRGDCWRCIASNDALCIRKKRCATGTGSRDKAQAAVTVFRTRDLFVRHRAQWVNALWGRLTEYGTIIAQGIVQFRRLMVNFDETAPDLPAPNLPAPVQGLCWFKNCAACTLSRYPFLMKRSGVSIKRYNTGQRPTRAHRVS